MMIQNQKGQAFVETLWLMTFIPLLVFLTLVGLHSLFVHYLTDHWTYQSTLCMIQEQPVGECRRVLQKNLELLPFVESKIVVIYRTHRKSRTQVEIKSNFLDPMIYDESISNDLHSSDFESHQ